MSKVGFSKRRFGSKMVMSGKSLVIRKKAPTVKSVAKSVKKINRRQELKFVDTYLPGTAFTSTGLITLLNGMVQGDSASQRNGNEITMTSVQFRVEFNTNGSQTGNSTWRMLIVYDKQTDGVAPGIGQILDTSTIGLAYIAPYNRNNQKRFKIIYDKTINVNPQVVHIFTPASGITTAVEPMGKLVRSKRQLQHIVKYSAGTAAVTDIVTGSLYLILVSDVASNPPLATMGVRVFYKD